MKSAVPHRFDAGRFSWWLPAAMGLYAAGRAIVLLQAKPASEPGMFNR